MIGGEDIRVLGQRLRMLVTRGLVTKSRVSKRTLLEVSGLASETGQQVELILPYGFSANPDGGDVLLLQVTGSRAHLVAIGADKAGLRITDLAAGEFGYQDNNKQRIVFRTDKIEVSTPLAITVVGKSFDLTTSGNITITAGGKIMLGGAGGKAVVVDGDPVKGGVVHATVQDVTAK